MTAVGGGRLPQFGLGIHNQRSPLLAFREDGKKGAYSG